MFKEILRRSIRAHVKCNDDENRSGRKRQGGNKTQYPIRAYRSKNPRTLCGCRCIVAAGEESQATRDEYGKWQSKKQHPKRPHPCRIPHDDPLRRGLKRLYVPSHHRSQKEDGWKNEEQLRESAPFGVHNSSTLQPKKTYHNSMHQSTHLHSLRNSEVR